MHRLLAMIAWQMRQLITLQDCLQRRVNPKMQEYGCHASKSAAERALRSRPISADQ